MPCWWVFRFHAIAPSPPPKRTTCTSTLAMARNFFTVVCLGCSVNPVETWSDSVKAVQAIAAWWRSISSPGNSALNRPLPCSLRFSACCQANRWKPRPLIHGPLSWQWHLFRESWWCIRGKSKFSVFYIIALMNDAVVVHIQFQSKTSTRHFSRRARECCIVM